MMHTVRCYLCIVVSLTKSHGAGIGWISRHVEVYVGARGVCK